jgi:hypothetical protein
VKFCSKEGAEHEEKSIQRRTDHYVSKKVDKLGAGMASSGLAKDFAALGIEGSVKGKGSMGNTQNHGLWLCLEKGRTGSRRSKAWRAVFSFTQKMAA